MKKNKLLFMFLLPFVLSSCRPGNETEVELTDYVSEIEFKNEDFKILQMTDIHWNLITNLEKETKYITTLVKGVNPDMLMITGDSFLIGNKNLCKYFFNMLESLEVPYALTWGNHDEEGEYTKNWLSKYVGSLPHSLYKHVDDDVFGDSNYVVNIKKNNETFYQVYAIDSNTDRYDKEYGYLYDYIHDDQIEWFKNETELAKTNSGYVPSIAYFHIPLWEAVYSHYGKRNLEGETEVINKGKYVMGDINEASSYTLNGLHTQDSEDKDNEDIIKMWPGRERTTMFKEAKERNVKGIFNGHDHSNNLVTQLDDVVMGYGVKTGRGLYYYGKADGAEFDITGGSLVTIKSDKTFNLQQVYLDADSVYNSTSIEDCEFKYSYEYNNERGVIQ